MACRALLVVPSGGFGLDRLALVAANQVLRVEHDALPEVMQPHDHCHDSEVGAWLYSCWVYSGDVPFF